MEGTVNANISKSMRDIFMLFWLIENLISNIGVGNFNRMILILTVFKILILKPIFGNNALGLAASPLSWLAVFKFLTHKIDLQIYSLTNNKFLSIALYNIYKCVRVTLFKCPLSTEINNTETTRPQTTNKCFKKSHGNSWKLS